MEETKTARNPLDQQAAAHYLGVSPNTVKAWRRRGVGPAYFKVGGRRVVYDQGDLDAFLQKDRVVPSAETGSREETA